MTYEDLLGKIECGEQFAFSRWGDGEWHCILGDEGQNCDGSRYDKLLSTELGSVLVMTPEYYLGMQPKAIRDMGLRIQKWCKEMNVDSDWCDADILHDASKFGRLGRFFDVLKLRNIILVSSFTDEELARLPFTLRHIRISSWNAWDHYTKTRQELSIEVQNNPVGTVVLFASGMMSNVLIDDMWKMYGEQYTFIDVGSLLDPYVGRSSRCYHGEIIKRESEKCV